MRKYGKNKQYVVLMTKNNNSNSNLSVCPPAENSCSISHKLGLTYGHKQRSQPQMKWNEFWSCMDCRTVSMNGIITQLKMMIINNNNNSPPGSLFVLICFLVHIFCFLIQNRKTSGESAQQDPVTDRKRHQWKLFPPADKGSLNISSGHFPSSMLPAALFTFPHCTKRKETFPEWIYSSNPNSSALLLVTDCWSGVSISHNYPEEGHWSPDPHSCNRKHWSCMFSATRATFVQGCRFL